MSTQFKEEYITDTESGSSEEASGSEEDVASWISWFCSLKGNEFFCEIEEDYIQDDFNLSGLCSQVIANIDFASIRALTLLAYALDFKL